MAPRKHNHLIQAASELGDWKIPAEKGIRGWNGDAKTRKRYLGTRLENWVEDDEIESACFSHDKGHNMSDADAGHV